MPLQLNRTQLLRINACKIEAIQIECLDSVAGVIGLQSWTSERARDDVGIRNVRRAAEFDTIDLKAKGVLRAHTEALIVQILVDPNRVEIAIGTLADVLMIGQRWTAYWPATLRS